MTGVAPWVLQRLPVTAIRKVTTQTAAGQVEVSLYEVSVAITDPLSPGGPWLAVPDLLVMELPIPLADTDVLVGLDLLLGCRLFLDGPARQFTLDF